MATTRPTKWYSWYADTDSKEDRKLILKLDLLIVPVAVIMYWIKYIDQSNINNAYVAGLSDDLGFYGNELVHLQTMYTVGAVVGQLPFTVLFPKLPMHWLIPGLDIGWGIFTLLQYRAKGYSEMMAYRFLVGLLESAYFPAVHYVLGSWYKSYEIGRRGGVFYTGLTLGTLTSGLIQSAASANLDGKNGLAGWRWMYVIVSIMTFAVGFAGIWLWPGTPDKPNLFILTKEEVELAKHRTGDIGQKPGSGFSWNIVTRVFLRWRFWILVLWAIFFWNACYNTNAGGYLLWLKSLDRYSASRVNQLGTSSPGIGIFYVLFICFGSDMFLGRAGAITLAHVWNLIGLIILLVWDVPESALWFAFNTTYSAVAMSSVLYGWANDILKHDIDERAFTLVAMNAIAQSTTAWTPLLVFKTVEAPRFLKGYAFTAANAVALIVMTQFIRILHNRQERLYEKQHSLETESPMAQDIQVSANKDIGRQN
ncbi:uncharacterized protein K452DRAFT_294479 [Aplosporella prunicola CBS 121167]|uniref:Major facilitator superfamily (MFS) profile domain-containing protein n=1 Tax=Aplosporella prunicola CBS 121167 TaxID=1176127 RepID=A0A6A6BW79_9PEZI|nr:uncharacterized protein K452DRAFT_294479 [Aplosporella prunicola CBS 121167]KAF2146961.1 hypothetical protein K452DRAFT_294479 [Aplosporella prunicola CBS 121167]